MKKTLLVLVLFVFAFIGQADNGMEHEYLGASGCQICHMGESNGYVFETWKKNVHAQAYNTLLSDKAKEISMSKLSTSKPPAENPECLKCHVSNYGFDTQQIANLDMSSGVTCESCHGNGGGYAQMSVMSNRELAVTKGLIADPFETCAKCHNEASPTYVKLNFRTAWNKIKHSRMNTTIPSSTSNTMESSGSYVPSPTDTYEDPAIPKPEVENPPSTEDSGN